MNLIQFDWPRGGDALQWVSARADGSEDVSRYLVFPDLELEGHEEYSDKFRLLEYQPLAEVKGSESLFRDFADLPETEEAILRFAASHGFLTGPEPVQWNEQTSSRPLSGVGEQFPDWVREIRVMRYAVRLWEAWRGRDQSDANTLMLPRERRSRANPGELLTLKEGHVFPLDSGEVAASVKRKLFTARPNVDDIDWRGNEPWVCAGGAASGPDTSAGFRVLRVLIREHLVGSFEPDIVLPSKDATVPVFSMRPATLLAALWLQLLTAATGDHQFRKCEGCGRWFDLAGRRDDAHHCGNTCRVRALRARKREAVARAR